MDGGHVGPNIRQPQPNDVFSRSWIHLISEHCPRSLSAISFGILFFFATIISAVSVPNSPGIHQVSVSMKNDLVTRQKAKAPLLNVIQATLPVNVPEDISCSMVLMDHSFGWSYDKPFVGQFSRYLN
jgi:hypothetical protein